MRIVRWLFDFLYGSVPAKFESAFGIEDSVRRLADATGRWVFAALTRQMAVGRVTAPRVVLQRAIPFIGNAYKPFFIGSFRVEGIRVVLIGKFTMHWAIKVFLSLWFGFCAFWTVLAFLLVAICHGYWWFPFCGVGMFLLGLGMVGLGKWFARNDVVWLSGVINRALSSPSS